MHHLVLSRVSFSSTITRLTCLIVIGPFSNLQPEYCYIGASRIGHFERDSVHIVSRFLVTKSNGLGTSPSSLISVWTVQLQSAGVDIVENMRWDLFQDALIELPHTPVLVVRAMSESAFKWILEAVLRGTILTSAHTAAKLQLIWQPTSAEHSQIDVLAIPSSYDVDNSTLVLDPMQRFEIALRDTEDAKEKYLRQVLHSVR